jgi:ATP-dependent exoDNAse (exonuclease V) beta subunit
MTKQPKLTFDKKKHVYKVGKQKLISVTTFVKEFFPKFDEKKFAKIIARQRTLKGTKTTMRDVLKEWKQVALNGTMVHQDIEEWLKLKKQPVLMCTRSLHAVQWLQDQAYHISATPEVKLYDTELGLAGTCDCIVHHDDGVVSIIDWKTNKAIKKQGYEKATHPAVMHLPNANYYHYQLQLSTYAYMLERQGNKIHRLVLAHLTQDGVVPYEVEYDKDTVIKMIEWRKANGKKE